MYAQVKQMIASSAVGVDLAAVARAHAASPEDWPFAPRFDPVRRWYARLASRPDYEVWLLTWLPGQETDLHDHGGSAGAFVVVSGSLTEYTVDRGREPGPPAALVRGVQPRASLVRAGAVRAFGSHHIHRLVNTGARPAVSVHAYGPALRAMTRYHISRGRLRVAAVDQAGAQW
jgi:hypothetical protein